MSRRRNVYDPHLRNWLTDYTKERDLNLLQFSQYHFRVTDNIYTIIDVWTSRKYYIKETNYSKWAKGTVERQGETGVLPKKRKAFFDELFFLLSKGVES